jgi:hypothetical protein
MRTHAQDFALVVAYTTGRITEKVFRDLISSSEHGADAGTPVSGPSRCSPASPRAGDKGDGLEGKPPVPRRVGEPGNDRLHRPPGAAAEGGTVRGEVRPSGVSE